MSKYQVGRLGKCFAKDESDYAVAPVFAATDALRHIEVNTSASLNRSDSLEKRGTPGLRDRFSRHITGLLDIKNAYLQPSGMIGTKPEANVILKNAFGVETVGSASTTIASAPTTTGATLTSGTGMAVGKAVSIVVAAGTAPGTYLRVLASVAGAVVTWTPALQGAPAAADTVKTCVQYTFANELPGGFSFAHYLPDLSVEMHGCVTDKLQIMFDANNEVTFSASCPAKERLRPAQTIPGSFTTVGSPITGIVGAFLFNGTAYQIMKLSSALTNAEALQNDIYGTDRAQGFYRNGRRSLALAVDARVTDDLAVVTQAEIASDNALLIQCNNVEGKTIGLYMPRVEFDVPQTPDGDGAMSYSFTGVAKEVSGNDEAILIFG
jgi:hypothetical protein